METTICKTEKECNHQSLLMPVSVTLPDAQAEWLLKELVAKRDAVRKIRDEAAVELKSLNETIAALSPAHTEAVPSAQKAPGSGRIKRGTSEGLIKAHLQSMVGLTGLVGATIEDISKAVGTSYSSTRRYLMAFADQGLARENKGEWEWIMPITETPEPPSLDDF